MENFSLADLRLRLAQALGLRECGSATARDGSTLKYYVDHNNKPMGLVKDWYPDDPKKIIQVIERYGLHVERIVHPDHKVKPGKEHEVVWQYHVWSRHPAYGNLANDEFAPRRHGARVTGPDLTSAVLLWAVLRAERVEVLRRDAVLYKHYNFERLQERVYVSSIK